MKQPTPCYNCGQPIRAEDANNATFTVECPCGISYSKELLLTIDPEAWNRWLEWGDRYHRPRRNP